jgi:hypothetical protein
MGDASAIGGWILAAAIVTVLAGGAHAASGPGGSGGSGPTRSGSSPRSTATASRSPDTNRTASPGATATAGGSAASCVRASRRVSVDGGHYKILPVAADGSPDCSLRLGDHGRAVTVLQQALLMCSNRAVRVDGTFTEDTRGALSRDQSRQLGVAPTGIYDSRTARVFAWPWYDTTTGKFTGRCGQVGDRAL